MFYSIRTRHSLSLLAPVRESVWNCACSRVEGPHDLALVQISTNPRSPALCLYRHLGNAGVYHFNILREHEELRIEAQATVGIDSPRALARKRSIPWNGAATTASISVTIVSIVLEPSRSRAFARVLSFMKIADHGKRLGPDPLNSAQDPAARILILLTMNPASPR